MASYCTYNCPICKLGYMETSREKSIVKCPICGYTEELDNISYIVYLSSDSNIIEDIDNEDNEI